MESSPTTVGFSLMAELADGVEVSVLGPCTMMHSAISFTVQCACLSFAQICRPLQKNHRRLNFERTRSCSVLSALLCRVTHARRKYHCTVYRCRVIGTSNVGRFRRDRGRKGCGKTGSTKQTTTASRRPHLTARCDSPVFHKKDHRTIALSTGYSHQPNYDSWPCIRLTGCLESCKADTKWRS
ncbi:hypothetical protein E4T42_09425 [Aureobasidium subglaciale]|nr:hypothetical protein E4T42_09425 [Aureobasidium subglaciale]